MKLLKILTEESCNLFEVGDGSTKKYNWSVLNQTKVWNGTNYEFTFSSENSQYIVDITHDEDSRSRVNVSFYANDDNEPDYQKLTNFNEVYNVISTVVDIVIEYLKMAEDNNEKIGIISMTPVTNQVDREKNRRQKLYRRYIDQNIHRLPGEWDILYGENDEISIWRKAMYGY